VSRVSVDASIEIVEREEERCQVRMKAGVDNVKLGGCMYEVQCHTLNRIEVGWNGHQLQVLERGYWQYVHNQSRAE
jgi:hypothetical protein